MKSQSEGFDTEPIDSGNETMHEFITFFRDLVIILIIVLFIRAFIVTPFRINGSSMESNYHDKEYILVDKFSYTNLPAEYSYAAKFGTGFSSLVAKTLNKIPVHISDPVRGDVVVITPHADISKEYYIKRIVGMPNDIIRFENGFVAIKKPGATEFIRINEPYLSLANSGHTFLPESTEGNQFTVPEGYYWIMGDNRNNSADARSCFRTCNGKDINAHFISRKDIIGHVLLDFGYFNIFGEGGLLSSGKISWTNPPRFLNHPRTATYPELGE
ncbi:signal peptidase I [Candidatus Gracilibacteria bacterium]|nr:signal peptidase I [Candidatus Gracilibacteria bacterium]